MAVSEWWRSRGQGSGLFLLQGMAMAAWYVPLSPMLDSHGLAALTPFAFGASAVAALVSPLVFGAIADRRVPPIRVLRWLSIGTMLLTCTASLAIERRASLAVVIVLIQVQAILSLPSWSLLYTITLSRLHDARRQFGPLRAMGTIGWMAGCWLVSGLEADTSTVAGQISGALWVLLAGFTLLIRDTPPVTAAGPASLRERLGLDALSLLANRDHRVVLLTAGLLAIPLAGFYPFMPIHLLQLGFHRTSAWMSLGQVTEIAAMFGLGLMLTHWRLKWIFACGLGFALVRYLLCAVDTRPAVLAGISLHGFAFTLFFVTAPIYLNERVNPAWRARAQALMSLMYQGVGNLLGYLGAGWWFRACETDTGTLWPRFWGGLAAVVGAVAVFFLTAYRGRPAGRASPS